MAQLSMAIERLYADFSAVLKPRHIVGCPCCIDRKGVGTLLEKRLRDLSPDELSSYAFSAFKTVGAPADYLYFLPRILEITATEPSWWPSPPITGGAIRDAEPEAWTAGQREALVEFLTAAVDASSQAGDYSLLDDWICAIAQMGFDVRPYLDRVAHDPAAVLGYFERNAASLSRGKLTNSFWDPPCSAHDAVVGWFHSDAIAQILFQAYGYRF